MSKRRKGTPSAFASCLESSVLPTPVGPVNRKQPIGRSTPESPARPRLTARTTVLIAASWPNTTARSSRLEVLEPLAVRDRRAHRGDVRHARDDRLDVAHADRLALLAWPQPHRGAGLVDHVDRLVGQEAVVHVAVREVDAGAERRGREAHAVVLLVLGREALRGSAPSPRRSAPSRRRAGSGARARGRARSGGTPGRWSSPCSAARRSGAAASACSRRRRWRPARTPRRGSCGSRR